MKLICSQVDHVGVAVLVVLLCVELSYKVEGVTTEVLLYNVGDDITLNCFPPANDYNYNSWYRNGTFLANVNSISYLVADHHISHNYTPYHTNSESLYSLYIYNAEILDSALYLCVYNIDTHVKQYDVRIIGCTCTITNHNNNDKEKVLCELENYRVVSSFRLGITINRNIYKEILIEGSSFSFAMSRHQLYNSLHFELQHLYTDAISNIRCMLPAQFTSPYPSTRHPTTPLLPTTHNGQAEASYTTSLEPISGVPISTVGHPTRQNKNSNQGKNLSDIDITTIIVIAGSVSILILIVLIVVLRCKQTKNRQGNKHNDILSVDGKDTKEHPEACYESVDDASQRGLRKSTSNEKMKDKSENQPNADHHGGMVENILYDSTDKIAEGSISRTEGPLDNALYAMPDKRKTLDRESKSGVIDGSSNADILYGNSSIIISQQEQKRDTLQRGDQYENVELPGSGGGVGAEEIPLYEMPDKAPQRNTFKATPKAEQTSTAPKEEVVNRDALYAEVDKTKKK